MTWEYRIYHLLDVDEKRLLTEFNHTDWELVSVLPMPGNEGHSYYFKRPVAEKEDDNV
jgi:hypothetical protein